MKRSNFYRYFPPPQFLQMPAVGLDISDTSLRFAELIETRKGLIIGRYAERAIPRGVIESGEVKKPTELNVIFKELKKEYNLEYVAMALPEEKAYLFDLRLPAMKYSQIRGAIELVFEEHVPIDIKDAVFDYDIESESETNINVRVTAAHNSLINGYLDAFQGTNIMPIAFEVEVQSIARAVIPEDSGETAMIVDFGKLRTGIAIVSNGGVKFTSTIAMGSNTLTEVIAKDLGVSYDEADKVKIDQGIEAGGENGNLSPSMITAINALRQEINKNYLYWQTHEDDFGKKRAPIQKIYLSGGGSNLLGFVSYLGTGLPVAVELANVMVNVNKLDQYVPEINFNDSLHYSTAIGLALRRPN